MKSNVAAALMLLAWLPLAGAQETRIGAGVRELPMAALGEPNPWPQFRFQLKGRPVVVPAGLSDEDRAGMAETTVVPPLPYLLQDNYTRVRRPGALPTIGIENAALRATIYPSLGGRFVSLFDKVRQRELLFDNPVFQPANLAIRNAWFSGGIEWNGPRYGHSLLTCCPVYAAVIDTPRGPLLRLYEFDRALETTWQVDLFLPAGEARLWVHVKAINPNPHAIAFYWWTNLAVPMTRQTRVLVPMDYALAHDPAGNRPLRFPEIDGFDGSYAALYPYAKSVFFRKPGSTHIWSAYVDGEGHGLSHVSTATLFGRKLFTWGTGRGGTRWMDYLAEEGRGDYLEIQGGVTPTQLQTRPLAAGASLEWTECLSPLALRAGEAHAPDYAAACAAAGREIEAGVPPKTLREIDSFLTVQADAPVRTMLARGSAWGRLHEQRTGRRLSGGLRFDGEIRDEERPWWELLTRGTFSAATQNEPPRSYNVSPGWTGVLQASMRAGNTTALHHLHLGVAQMEAGEFDEARRSFAASLALRPTALAHRNLALLAERDGDDPTARAAYEAAWTLASGDQDLAIEIGGYLVRHRHGAAFDAFASRLPAAVAAHERIQLLHAQRALERGDFRFVRDLLRREFCTIREGERSLTDLWFASHAVEAEQRAGRPLTEPEKRQIAETNPPPRAIDFRMK